MQSQKPPSHWPGPEPPPYGEPSPPPTAPPAPAPQPPKPPRGFTIGAGLELLGIGIAIFGLTVPFSTGGPTTQGSPVISGLGVIVALVGLLLHIARV